MRVAVIDIGTNSTRLLIGDVADDRVVEVERDSIVTRLGHGVDTSGELDAAAIERVVDAIAGYRDRIESAGAQATVAVATSAVRDASNGEHFRSELERRVGVAARIIDGDEEAQMTFAGVTHDDQVAQEVRTVVIDIGGGSTEFIIGHEGEIDFHVSTQIGAVRHGERHLFSDPPTEQEVAALLDDVTSIIAADVPAAMLSSIQQGVAVAGTPTVLASVEQELVPFDPWKVHGYMLTREACERILARLSSMTLAERREVKGLHPDRAPTIVAGAAIMTAAMRAFDLEAVEVSEHDLLYGLALRAAAD